MIPKPQRKPACPNFSSGPCTKHPGWRWDNLHDAFLGRAHRSQSGRRRIAELFERTRALLNIPADYRIGMVPGSDTGAMECAMWSLLGAHPVNVLAWDSFGDRWVTDIVDQLQISELHRFEATFGEIADLSQVNSDYDTVFVWNATSSGVVIPDASWIANDRKGLTLCDATSAVFALPLPWDKLDVATFSWQKALGGEAAHGMIVLSPRAVARLESYTPPWPIPGLFRLTKQNELIEAYFQDSPINTPSMMAVEDFLSALKWAESVGGHPALNERVQTNQSVIEKWVKATPWVDYLPANAAIRSPTSVCLKIVDPWFTSRRENDQMALIKRFTELLAEEDAALDIGPYRLAPPGLRIWCGCTVERQDLVDLTPWLDWAYDQIRQE